MEITPFEDLRVTTMTLVMSLTNGVNMDAAFHLLPITRIALQQTRQSSKCKLPHCEIPGAILSMRYGRNTRGVIRSRAKPFKNAVTIDISTTKKNISLKLSPYSIQMCGASSRDDGIEAANHVLNHLKNVQRLMYKIQDDFPKSLEIVQWVKTNTRGDLVEKATFEFKQYDNATLQIYRPSIDNSIKLPTEKFPEHLDSEIMMFLLSMADDFLYHQDYCKKLDYMLRFGEIIHQPLEILHVNEAMVNYNFSLGFEVDRSLLNQYMDGRDGFISRYNNALVTSVTIELPYEAPADQNIKCRNGKRLHHSFLVYKSSSTTFSGRNMELMKLAYYKFWKAIIELRPFIEYRPSNYQIMAS